MDIKSCLASAPVLAPYASASANSIALLMGRYYKGELQEDGANNLHNCAYLSCVALLRVFIPLGNCVVGFLECAGYPIDMITKKLLNIEAKGSL